MCPITGATTLQWMQLATKGNTASYIKILAIAIRTGVAIHLKLAIPYKIVHLLASSLSHIAAREIHRMIFGEFIV